MVNNWLIIPLFGIGKLHYAYSSSSVIEAVEELKLHLVPTDNALKCKVSIPIKGIPSEGSNKLFDQEVILYIFIVQVTMK